MRSWWKVALGVVVGLPMGAYVVGTLVASAEEPAPRETIVIQRDSGSPSPSADSTGRSGPDEGRRSGSGDPARTDDPDDSDDSDGPDDDDDVETVVPEPDDLDDDDDSSGPGGDDDSSGPGGGDDDSSGPGGGDDDRDDRDDHSGPGSGDDD